MELQLNDNINKKDIVDLLKESLTYLDRVILFKAVLIEALDNEDYQKLYTNLEDLFEGLGWLNKLLKDLRDILNLDYQALFVGNNGETAIDKINKFNKFLNELNVCLQSQDYVLLNDILEYEFDEQIKEYQQIFVEIDSFLNDKIN